MGSLRLREWIGTTAAFPHFMLFLFQSSLYFVFCSELFSDNNSSGIITVRYSSLSTFALGTSVGYFISDRGMICWLFFWNDHVGPDTLKVAYSIYTGEGQLYTFMPLISGATTPMINLRWYLDMAGLKKSTAYLINGVLILFSWLVARFLLFVYMFHRIYLHGAQVMQMHTFGVVLVLCVPVVLGIMNLVWLGKILKGLKKTITKRK